MNQDHINKIISILKANDDKSVPYIQVKEKLLAQGYQEKEIIYALYSFPYDGRPNLRPKDDPVRRMYEDHPEQADKVAKIILHDMAEEDLKKTIAYGMASEVAGQLRDYHAESYYGMKFLDNLGLPYYTISFAVAVAIVIGIATDMSDIVMGLLAVSLAGLIIYALYKKIQTL